MWKALNGKEFENKKEALIEGSQEILEMYDDAITLRQLYYRLVARNLIENKQSNYQYLSRAMVEARLDGRIGFEDIEDRTRSVEGGDWMDITPQRRLEMAVERIKELPERHCKPMWLMQPYYVEIWCEKQALSNIFEAVGYTYCVKSFASRGYTSWTALYDGAMRFQEQSDQGKEVVLLYFGDYDPSGKDIERFIRSTMQRTFNLDLTVKRVGLTKDQIDQYKLPPQPCKSSDARYDQFVADHGNIAVELDALEPSILKDMIEESISEYYDETIYQRHIRATEESEQEWLRAKVEQMLDALNDALNSS